MIFKNIFQNIKTSSLSVKILLYYSDMIFCPGKTGWIDTWQLFHNILFYVHPLVCQKFITEDIEVCKGYWILWAPINLECMRTGSLVILKRTRLKQHCVLWICVSFLFWLFFLDTWHSSHVFPPHEPTSHSPENSHYSLGVHATIFPAFSSQLS